MVEEIKGAEQVQLPRFELLEKIGGGAHHEVWLANIHENEVGEERIRHVAVKLSKLTENSTLRHEFDTLMAVGRHPHIIGYIEYCSNADRLIISTN